MWLQPCFQDISKTLKWICIYSFYLPILCARWQLSRGRKWKMYTHGGGRKFSQRAPILPQQKALCCQTGGRCEAFKPLFDAPQSQLQFVLSLIKIFKFRLHHFSCNRIVVTSYWPVQFSSVHSAAFISLSLSGCLRDCFCFFKQWFWGSIQMDARAGESMYLYEKVTLFISVLLLLRLYFFGQ